MSGYRKYSNLQCASLMERIKDFIASASCSGMNASVRFRMVILAMETQHLSSAIGAERHFRLGDYFGNGPLRESLEYVRKIDLLKKYLTRRVSPLLSGRADEFVDKDFLDNDQDRDLPNSLQGDDVVKLPPMTSSLLWNNGNRQRIGQAFYGAYIDYAEDASSDNPVEDASSDNPVDDGYNDCRHLMQHTICNVEGGDHGGIPCLKSYDIAMREALRHLDNQRIFNDLMEALEELRIAFMEQAHDIYCVRTGAPALLPGKDEEIDFDRYYTVLPLRDYYKDRDAWRYDVEYDLDHKLLDKWRKSHRITSRKLTREESIRFLTERKKDILSCMEHDYKPLWELRERSGGYEVEVNADNFARNFYARRGTDPRFFQLEWELEYIDERLADIQEQMAVPQAEQRTPQQQAIDEFSDKLTRLITTCYDQWNGKRCTPAAHQPEVVIVIQKEQMIQLLRQQQEESTKTLLNYCYPPTSQTKRTFCNYVLQLVDKGYFGSLPKKELALLLAPIVGLSSGTVTNYLSPA